MHIWRTEYGWWDCKLGNCYNNPLKKLSGLERVVARWGKVEKKDSRDVKLAESTGPGSWLDTWDGEI